MPSRKKKGAEYRKCDCGESWKTRDALLHDKTVKIIGYQPDFVNHKYNHFLFQHKAKGCGAFFGVRASDFKDLREKECPNDLCFGHDECPGYCMDTSDLHICSVTCRNASDRLIASKIKTRRILQKLKAASAGAKGGKKKKKQIAGTG
jgi:hypothetical protein